MAGTVVQGTWPYVNGGGDFSIACIWKGVQDQLADDLNRMTVYGLLFIASTLLMSDMVRLHTYIRPL